VSPVLPVAAASFASESPDGSAPHLRAIDPERTARVGKIECLLELLRTCSISALAAAPARRGIPFASAGSLPISGRAARRLLIISQNAHLRMTQAVRMRVAPAVSWRIVTMSCASSRPDCALLRNRPVHGGRIAGVLSFRQDQQFDALACLDRDPLSDWPRPALRKVLETGRSGTRRTPVPARRPPSMIQDPGDAVPHTASAR